MRRHRSLVASAFTLLVSMVGVLGFFGRADAASRNQLLPPKRSVCPVGSTPVLTGVYKGLCKTVNGVVFNPITGQILSSPPPTPTVPPNVGSLIPPTRPPSGNQPQPGTGTGPSAPPRVQPSRSSGRTHLISSSVSASRSYGTPYGVYFGNVGGSGSTYFSANTGLSKFEYRKVDYVGAFGQSMDSDVSTTVIDASRVAPVSTNLAPHAPDEVWLLLPFGLVLLTVISYLVLEPDSDRAVAHK